MAENQLRVELLGRVRAWRDDREVPVGPPRRQAVLAVLALRANRVVSRDDIVSAVWDDDPPPSAVNGVHIHVAALRKVLDPGRERRAASQVLVGTGTGYLLQLPAGQLDLDVFGEHLDRGGRLLAAGEPARAVEAYDAGLRLWQGTPLSGVAGPLADVERVRLGELRLAAIEDRAEALLALGRYGVLVPELIALAAEHPLRERLCALLMTALYHGGRQADALTLYADTRRRLAEEFGVEPGAQLRCLHYTILTSRFTSGGVQPAAVPYR
jgi:DNA-binding SARP family transcriptional activator